MFPWERPDVIFRELTNEKARNSNRLIRELQEVIFDELIRGTLGCDWLFRKYIKTQTLLLLSILLLLMH